MRAVSSVAPATPLPQAELDLAYARAAVADVLSGPVTNDNRH
jgi:hypothetical protein